MATSKSLIIVESPAKTKTLKNFLGSEFDIQASMGHVRDLPKSKLGVDVEGDFKPQYIAIPERKKVITELKKAAKNAADIYIASDPDREGEAIAWHLMEALGLKDAKRIEFNQITKQAVLDALQNARELNSSRVDAQQARRVLDRLVGYKISPLLWSKVKRNLSAGRVQSVAVRLICDREREIQAFSPEEYWSIIARLTPEGEVFPFDAKLVKVGKEKAVISDQQLAQSLVDRLKSASYTVQSVNTSQRRRNAPAPFITSTLQQEASRKLGYTSTRTMRIAQELYEGVELGAEGAVGLITYLRTDSTRVAEEAVAEAREYIAGKYGKEYLPEAPRQHKKRKEAQDAHEAIRPTSILREPDKIKSFLSPDQYKLYKLIWLRFAASQMSAAVYDVETVEITAEDCLFRATGSTERFKGFRILYVEGSDDAAAEPADEDRPPLPQLTAGNLLKLLELLPEQHFTEPPPRYTEASLVKALEENGIGRPSTYANIISTIKDRKYVTLEQKRFTPTELGFVVTDLLVKHFPSILDVKFTASVESRLDEVEQGAQSWVTLLKDFYEPFASALSDAQETMERVKVEPKETDEICEKCGSTMLLREGRFGPFLGCSAYPECKNIKNIKKDVGVPCPVCEKGQIIERVSRKGKPFYGCDQYPECSFVAWDRPINEKCPECGSILTTKTSKARGDFIKCSSRECSYSRDAAPEGEPELEAMAS